MIDKFIQFLYYLLFFVTPLLFIPTTSELFEFNKIIFIYIITSLVVFLWLVRMILTKKIIFKKTTLDLPIILFLISQALAVVFSIDRHVSLFGYYGRFNGGFVSIICYVILYYGMVWNSVNILKILKSSIWSSIVVMAYGLPGKLGHDLTCFFVSVGKIFNNSCWSRETNIFNPADRTFSTLGQPNWLGAYLAVNFFIGIYYLYKRSNISPPVGEKNYLSKIKNNFLPSLYLFVNFSFILFSRSRSALMAVGIGLVLLVSYYFFFINKEFKKVVITLLIIIIIPVLLFKTGIEKVDKIISFPTSFFQSPKSLPASKIKLSTPPSEITESLDIRKIVWKGAINLGLKYPLFGTGVETFAYSYNFVRPVKHNLTTEWDFIYNKAHNEFLNYFATTGFIGLGTYMLLIFGFIFLVINQFFNKKILSYDNLIKNKKLNSKADFDIYNKRFLTLCLSIGYLTLLITNFFGFSTTTINLFFYLIPGIVIALYKKDDDINKTDLIKKPSNYQYLIIFFVSLILVYIQFSTVTFWIADNYYARGINYLKPQISDYQKAATNFESALKLRNESIYQDRFSSSLSYLAAIAAYQKQSDLAKQLINISDFYNKKSLDSSPKNIFYWKTRAKNQYLFYQINLDPKELSEGILALQNSEKLAPTDPKIPYSLAVYYSLIYDQSTDISIKTQAKTASLEKINKALILKKDFTDGINLKKELLKKYNTF